MQRLILLIIACLIASSICNKSFLSKTLRDGDDAVDIFVDLFAGIANGTSIFKNLTNPEACDIRQHPDIAKDIYLIARDLNNFNIHKNITKQILRLVSHVNDISKLLNSFYAQCIQEEREAVQEWNQFQIFFEENFNTKNLIDHTIQNASEIAKEYNHIVDLFNQEYYDGIAFESGQALGSFIKFVLFWEYQ